MFFVSPILTHLGGTRLSRIQVYYKKQQQASTLPPHLLKPTDCATRFAFGVKRLPDNSHSPQERAVRDRRVRASCVGTPLGEVLLTIRRAPRDLQCVSEGQSSGNEGD